MKQSVFSMAMAAAGLGVVIAHLPMSAALADDTTSSVAAPSTPIIFQAAGPNAASIQSTVDAFRAALGEPNNGSDPGPLPAGRREINWDGGGSDSTTAPETPFDGFLDSRGSRFTTPGIGLSQAPASGGPEGGLAVLFDNPSYATTFVPFSPVRFFTPVDSNVTDAWFFVPGTDGSMPATVSAFGAVFADVNEPDGLGRDQQAKDRGASVRVDYYGVGNQLLFSSVVPSSPGVGSLSFFGVQFDDARIARVRITTGDVAPGPNDSVNRDIVVMDDFVYGEPQLRE